MVQCHAIGNTGLNSAHGVASQVPWHTQLDFGCMRGCCTLIYMTNSLETSMHTIQACAGTLGPHESAGQAFNMSSHGHLCTLDDYGGVADTISISVVPSLLTCSSLRRVSNHAVKQVIAHAEGAVLPQHNCTAARHTTCSIRIIARSTSAAAA